MKRYTGYAHPAGSGYDYASALTLKNDWEKELGLRVSGPQEFIYDAGSPESQARVKNGMDKLGVWIDTVNGFFQSFPLNVPQTHLGDSTIRS